MSARITLNVSKAAVTSQTLPPATSGNVVMTLAGLRASTNASITSTVTTTDFGGGIWYYAGPYDGNVEDNTGTVIVTANGKVWKRIYDGEIHANWFGVVTDGVTDTSAQLQAAYDYCEVNSIKRLIIHGDHYLENPLKVNRGGTQLIGTGALLREESWGVLFPSDYPVNKPFSGCSLIANTNKAAVEITAKAVDPIVVKGIQFKVKGDDRTIGTTTGIHFKGEWEGPVWPFIVEECHFRGFNYAIKIESPVQYCLASMQIIRNAFSQNDECLYLADIPNDRVVNVGQRNLSWGLTFTHNKCHDNGRIIRGTFSKNMLRITDNNGEGNIPYIAGGYPNALIDIEISNCSATFESNHFEGVTSSKCIKVSSNFVLANGTVQGYGNTTQNSAIHRVYLRGNNFDGVNASIVPVEVTGCVVFNDDRYRIDGHGIFLENNKLNRQSVFMSAEAKVAGTTFKFPVNGTETRASNTASEVAWMRTAKFNGGSNMFMTNTPLGLRQVVAAKNSRMGSIAVGHAGNWDNTIKYIGATFLVNSSDQSDFLDSLFFSRHYRNSQGNMVHDSVKPYNAIYGVPNGWSFITTYMPNPFPADSTERSGFFGLGTGELQDKEILVACDYTAFGFTIDNPMAVPYFSDRVLIEKDGTFYTGQSFKQGQDLNFVIDGGTVGTLESTTATSTSIFDDFVTVNTTTGIIAGNRIRIGSKNFWVIKVEGNIIRLDDTIDAVLTNSPVQFAPPAFTIDGTIKAGFLTANYDVNTNGGLKIQESWYLYKLGALAYLRDLVNNRMHLELLPGINDAEARTTMYSSAMIMGNVGFNGHDPVGKAADPGTATGTDAAVINALTIALRNVGLVS